MCSNEEPIKPLGPESDNNPFTQVPKSKPIDENLEKDEGFYYSQNFSTEGKAGLGIIIVNRTFEKYEKLKRNGAEKDKENFEAIFDKCLIGYKNRSYFDLTAGQMWELLKEFADLCKDKQCSVIMVAISTHGGDQGDISGTDNIMISLRHIFKFFGLSALSHIPKVFLIQACRGDQSENRIVENVAFPIPQEIRETSNITTSMSNTLIAYSTGEGCLSWRDAVNGSWFVNFLCLCVHHEPYKDMHFVEILTICIDLVIRKEFPKTKDGDITQTVSYQSTLTKFLPLVRKD